MTHPRTRSASPARGESRDRARSRRRRAHRPRCRCQVPCSPTPENHPMPGVKVAVVAKRPSGWPLGTGSARRSNGGRCVRRARCRASRAPRDPAGTAIGPRLVRSSALRCHEPSGMVFAPVRDQAGVGETVEDAFAVFVARPRVTARQRTRQRIEFGVGFVDDDRRTFLPREQLRRELRAERDAAVKRLLDEDQPVEKSGQRRDRRAVPPTARGTGATAWKFSLPSSVKRHALASRPMTSAMRRSRARSFARHRRSA